MTPDEMVAAVVQQGGFDTRSANVSVATILGWLNEKRREIVGESRWAKAIRELGPTVVAQSQYELPGDVVDVMGVRVGGGRPLLRIGTADLWELQSGGGRIVGGAGGFAPNFTTSGVSVVELWPAPGEAGQPISALVAALPPDLALGGAADTLLPEDVQQGIVDGAIGIGFSRIYERPSDGAAHEARFQAKLQKLSRRANSRVGSGPVRIRVSGSR